MLSENTVRWRLLEQMSKLSKSLWRHLLNTAPPIFWSGNRPFFLFVGPYCNVICMKMSTLIMHIFSLYSAIICFFDENGNLFSKWVPERNQFITLWGYFTESTSFISLSSIELKTKSKNINELFCLHMNIE